MRIGELRGLTSLPIHRIREHFRYEEVLTVLPVRDTRTSRETLFVATRHTLALLTALRVPPGHWATRWAPWEAVRIPDPPPSQSAEEDVHRLSVVVGSQLFSAELYGETGRRAIRDFVIAFRTARPMKAKSP